MPIMPETVPLQNRNSRTTEEIIVELHRALRQEVENVFDQGELLIELKEQIGDREEFLDKVWDEFGFREDTAANRMAVARLGFRSPNVRALKVFKSTLVAVTRYPEEIQPTIIAELAKHATDSPLRHCDALQFIEVGKGRYRYGDLPDGTLYGLADLDHSIEDEGQELPFHQTARAAMLERRPTTIEEAEDITDNAIAEERSARESAQEDLALNRYQSNRRGRRRRNRRNGPAAPAPQASEPEPAGVGETSPEPQDLTPVGETETAGGDEAGQGESTSTAPQQPEPQANPPSPFDARLFAHRDSANALLEVPGQSVASSLTPVEIINIKDRLAEAVAYVGNVATQMLAAGGES